VSEVSIGALFLAGLIPGLLLALVFAVFCIVQASVRRDLSVPERATFVSMVRSARRSVWALLAPPVVMGGIYLGIFTASEAAAAGTFSALLVAVLIYRNFGIRDLAACAYQTMRTSMMVFMIIAGGAMFGHAITIIRLPVGVTEAVVNMGLGPLGFVIAVMMLIFALGMFLESIAIILITTPILLPTMNYLGIDPVWYGILLMVNLELAMITPPVGMNLFVIKGITDAPLTEVVKGAAPFVALMIFGLAVLILFPPIATWLPYSAGFGR
jgi:C4-dicarboxylate transporter DctM subunit